MLYNAPNHYPEDIGRVVARAHALRAEFAAELVKQAAGAIARLFRRAPAKTPTPTPTGHGPLAGANA